MKCEYFFSVGHANEKLIRIYPTVYRFEKSEVFYGIEKYWDYLWTLCEDPISKIISWNGSNRIIWAWVTCQQYTTEEEKWFCEKRFQ